LILDNEKLSQQNLDILRSFEANFSTIEIKSDEKLCSLHDILNDEQVLGSQKQKLVKMI
jgi:hypothetical protein